ncbi:kinesin-like protein KIN-12E isoform X2 [Prosopis cineraria]|uniref:kinesin-like protein KIN-12E isoform X2 n=1 Tax=Prosopis cineraria TaxID=364024 RepID=UPI00240F2220|nr:kinesin-like protein KIN-12E isoform X2 [Prosopis cineraria]
MPFISEAASAIKSRFGFQDHSSDTFSLVQRTPDLLKSTAKENIVHSSAVRSSNDLDEDGVGDCSAVSASQSFEFCEDPSFWMDHNVQVIIRIRPLSNGELSLQGYSKCVRQESSQAITWIGPPESRFTFDLVADENVSQETLFKVAGLPMVENCMGGYNSCMFAYGQTGSGKTHTMLGDIEGGTRRHSVNCGMTPRVFEHLFSRIQKEKEARRDEKLKFTCKCSFLEIYNEQILDLLEPSFNNLQIREDSKKGIYVENLKEVEVTSARDVIQQLLHGSANRKVAATNMNRASSRSHSVFTCIIESKWESQGVTHHRFARLNLVDLAGSERQKSSGAEGERLKEATNINKSLSTLGLVIMNLVSISNGKSLHVPYRDSKLTFLLQDSLGGNSKTIIIANISPSTCCSLETLSTLKFAQRAKFIKNNAIVNEDASGDVIAMRMQIQQLKKEISRLQGLGGGEAQDNDISVINFPGSPGSFKWEGNNGLFSPLTSGKKISQKKDYEVALVGAFRREKDKEMALQALRAENQAAMQLAKQREDEIQGLKMRLRFREAGIKRLEAIASGKISAEAHLLKEKEEHLKEIEVLRAQVDRNQEVTRFAMENLRLKEEIRRLKSFFEEGEREVMNEQIIVLENKLLEALDWKLMHEADMKTNSDSVMEGANGDGNLISKEAIQRREEMDSMCKKLEFCLEEKAKLERQVDDLAAKLEQEKLQAMKEGSREMEIPSSCNMPIISINDQLELKAMVDAIAAASQREAEAHETAIILSKENDELKMKLKVLIEDNSKLIELYELVAAESNNRIVNKAEDAREVAVQVNGGCSPEGAREEDTESEMKRVIENLQHQVLEMNEENEKLMSLYERAVQERNDLLHQQVAAESNNRIVNKAEDARAVAARVNGGCSPEGTREVDTEMKRVIENLQHQLLEMNEENEKLMSLYERAMQERDDLKIVLSSCVHERAESKREMECPEKLVEVDEGEKDSSIETGFQEMQGIIESKGLDTLSGSSLCIVCDEHNVPSQTSPQLNDHLESGELPGHVKERVLLEGSASIKESRVNHEVDIAVYSDMDIEVLTAKGLSCELSQARKKLERVEEQISNVVRTLAALDCAEKATIEVDKLSREIEVIESDIQIKHQQIESLKLLLSEAQERRTLVDKKFSAVNYSLSNFASSFSYFEKREVQARAVVCELTRCIDKKREELASLQACKLGVENAKKKNQESEVELVANIAFTKSLLEEENRKREGEKVLFAIDNIQNIDSSQKNWHMSGKATELLKSEEEITKLQAAIRLSQEKLGITRKELGNLKKKNSTLEEQIQVVQLEIQEILSKTEEKELALQRVVSEKEMLLEFRNNGMTEIESMIVEFQEYVFESDLKQAEIKILEEELQMGFGRIVELQTARAIASSKKANLLASTSSSCLLEKMEEEMQNVKVSVWETKLLLEEGSSHAA